MATPLSGLTWGSKTVTWAFAAPGNGTGLGTVTSAIIEAAQQAAVIAGIKQWAAISGVNLVQVADPTQANVQIGYGEPAGLLGECLWSYNPTTSHYNSALVLLEDPAADPLMANSSGQLIYSGLVTTLQQLATHEFGAALGLAEGTGSDPNSVMNHVQGASNQVPDAADIAAIDTLYGSAAPPPAPSPPPTPTPPIVTLQTLSLVLSEDAWKGNAQFVVKVDGTKIGGPTSVTALHGQQATNTFSYSGDWGAGAHVVEIDFVNDAYGGSAAKDRNLYVDQVRYDGLMVLTAPHAMYSNGAFTIQVGHQ